MTLIEFFDKAAIENIAGALLCEAEKVVFVGDKRKQMERAIELYRDVLDKNNIKAELSYRSVNKNNLQDITDALTQIAEENVDCVFDLTGGEDLYLVAIGIITERYQGRIKCHRFNFKNETLYDCDADGSVCASKTFDISIDDHVKIYGGEIVTDEKKEIYTYPWDFGEDFLCDIDSMWEICRQNTRQWNAHINTVGAVCELFALNDSLKVSFDRDIAQAELKKRGIKFVFAQSIMYELQKHGLIHSLVMQGKISFAFKNEQIKRSLTVAGQVLELAVAKAMRSVKEKDGSPLYHDVRVGVVIDWDTSDISGEYRTINEIDVMAMKGTIPIFISCKNGLFDANELYKLDAVAENFGGDYAKRAIVSTELDKFGERADYIRARMNDMGIRCIEKADEIGESELVRILRSLYSN